MLNAVLAAFGCTGPAASDSAEGTKCIEAPTIEDLQALGGSGASHVVCANAWEGELVVTGSTLEFEAGSVLSSEVGTPLTVESGPASITGLTVQGGVGTTSGPYVIGGCVVVEDDVDATFSHVDVSGCAAQVGAGLWVGTGATVTLTSVSVMNNEAADIGGGIFVRPDAQLQVSSLEVSKNTAQYGGGLHLASGAALSGDSRFVDNSALYGAGAYIASGSVSGVTLQGNSATYDGGGAWISEGLFVDGEVLNNSAGSEGGGVYATGGFSADDDAVVVRSVRIVENTAEHGGGGVYLHGLRLALIDSAVLRNEAGSGQGGGVSMTGGVHTLCSNETDYGGVDDSNSPADLDAGNWAEIDGVATFTCEPDNDYWPCLPDVVTSWCE